MDSEHVTTHFSPNADKKALITRYKNDPCTETHLRLIINHRQQFLLCCEDMVGNFNLGLFPMISLEKYWFGEKRLKIVKDLDKAGGRKKYSYCRTCPRV